MSGAGPVMAVPASRAVPVPGAVAGPVATAGAGACPVPVADAVPPLVARELAAFCPVPVAAATAAFGDTDAMSAPVSCPSDVPVAVASPAVALVAGGGTVANAAGCCGCWKNLRHVPPG